VSYVTLSQQPLRLDTVEMTEIVRMVVANLRVTLKTRGGSIDYDQLPSLRGDRKHMLRLMQDLVDNALKFVTTESPCVWITAKECLCIDGELTAAGEPEASRYWLFSVKDNGIGIPSEHHTKIFELFEKLHPRTKYDGTGIGLAACRMIVERHGGRIWIESPPNEGTTFFFTLPHHPPYPEEWMTETQWGAMTHE
ncbi:MAG: hypothetical protein GF344_12155, partial [Chitinivibrionales bacterium]|nr:hypothetical protein [Chitinivibrionales bacterium]